MIHSSADALDLKIYAMLAAQLSDASIMQLARLRMRYSQEPSWPKPDLCRLEFYRLLADGGIIGSQDRHATLQGIKDLRWIDFAGMDGLRAPPYSG